MGRPLFGLRRQRIAKKEWKGIAKKLGQGIVYGFGFI
jgi:hypothetical protein